MAQEPMTRQERFKGLFWIILAAALFFGLPCFVWSHSPPANTPPDYGQMLDSQQLPVRP